MYDSTYRLIMFNRIYCASGVCTILSIGFLIGGILLITFSDSIIQKSVEKECQLKQGTFGYKLWRNPPVPFYISIYVFDLINENDFLNGAKPQLIQRGPFVYKEQRTKDDVRLYPNRTISYRELRNYTFDRSRSSDDETFSINTINVVYMTLINYLQMEDISYAIRVVIETALSLIEKPVMQLTVKEYLWGYQDPILSTLKKRLPQLISNDQVSVFGAAVNEAQYETYLINTGIKDLTNLGQIERFNFSTNLSIWSNEYANMINGTDSTIWHPNARKDELIYTFMNDICRSVHLEYNQTHRNLFNIDTYQYTLPKNVFANSNDNEGFCLKDRTEKRKCLPDGLFSLSSCVHLSGSPVGISLPIIASNPHFLDADRLVQDAVIGLIPNELLHRSYAEIEPVTGIVMNGSRRMQFNINVVNDSAIKATSGIHPLVYPMIWVNEHAEIDQSNADMFHKKVFLPLTILGVIKYILLSIGIILFIIVIGLVIYKHKQDPVRPTETPEPVISGDETTPLLA